MDFKKKNKIFQSSTKALAELNGKLAADAAEYLQVIDELELALEESKEDQVIKWYAREVALQAGSSMYEIYNPGRLLLNDFLQMNFVIGMINRVGAREHDGLVRVGPDEKIEVYGPDGWIDLRARTILGWYEEYTRPLKLIADISRAAGGYVWPDLDMTLDQWFRFHEIDPPKNNAEVRNLIALLKFDPVVDNPVNYWEHFQEGGQGLLKLTQDEFSEIRRATAKITLGRKLLTILHSISGRPRITHKNAAQQIKNLVTHAGSLVIARRYLEELEWFGANAQEEVSESVLAQLLITAILLDLHTSIDQSLRRGRVAEFDLYAATNVERHASSVLHDLSSFLQTKQWVDAALAPLAAHMLLTRIAPEFLVSGIPSSVTLGSIAWINFSRGVTLVNAVKTGAAQVMTYTQIMAYADLYPVSDAQRHLRDLTMIDPIVDWALLNQVVTRAELDEAEEATTKRAIAAFEQHAEKFSQIAQAFSTVLPDRAKIARAALSVAAPGCDTLDEKALSEQGGQQIMSMVDLHQSGDLVTGKWDRRTVRLITNGVPRPAINYNPSGVSLYKHYPQLLALKSCDEEMDRQLAVYRSDLDEAMLTTVKMALALMPDTDLHAFMNAKIHFLTVRGSAIYTATKRIGGPLDKDFQNETLQSRDAATGRFGVVMFATYNNAVICYELFTSRGEFRKNDALGELIVRQRTLQQRSRMSRPADLTSQLPFTSLQLLPLNVKCYTHGVAPDASISSSMAFIDNFGALPEPQTTANPKMGFYQRINDPDVARIAEFIVAHRPFLNARELRELVRVPTPLELSREEGERLITYFINLVVPFKKCIEDITSGEHDKVVDGIYGCLMDGIGLVGTVAGASSKVLSISAKAISTTAKAARFTKLAFTSAISLFNPLDGVPSGIQLGGKLVHKGFLRFNKNSHALIAKANKQLRSLRPRQHPHVLFDNNGSAQFALGTWRPRSVASDAVAILAVRRDNKWYALNRRGDVWGKPLDGFRQNAPLPLPYPTKTLPESYSRSFIDKSLPRARAKIDNALEAISRHDFKRDCSRVMKILFGDSSSVAIDRLIIYLRLIRFDFAGFSLSNIVLDAIKENETIAAFDVNAYKRWKNEGATNGADQAFVEIYTKNLNKHFISLGFNHDVVADDLIHELFHASAQTDDVGYATDAQAEKTEGQQLNVATLLNIASGCLPVSEGSTVCHAPSKAFENADSLAMATSLLSQLCTDKVTFDRNMADITSALEASGANAITEPVIITLNKPA